MPNTALAALPYPSLTSPNNPPSDLQALATALDPLVAPQIQTWTVAWSQSGGTSLSIGNGTLVGEYVKIGRHVTYRIVLTRGSTTNMGTATYFFSLPVAANANAQGAGQAVITVGGAPKMGIARMPTSTLVAVLRPDDSGLGPSSFSWATGDTIAINGTYLAAS